MSRLEKKCFIGSAALHGLLLVSFVAGTAFLSSKKPEPLPPVITMVNPIVTDRPIASGGNPNAQPAPAPPKIETPPVLPQPQPQPQPPPPVVKQEVKPREPDPEPPPPKKTEVAQKKPDKAPLPAKDKTPIRKPTETAKNDSAKTPLKLTPVRRTNNWPQIQQELAAKAAAEKRRQEEWNRYLAQRERIAREAGKILDGVGSSLETRSVAEPAGPGGAAYVNYGSLIIEYYKRAVYASNPQSDHDAEAVIRVVIARDGTVRRSEWVKRTSNPVLNKAVDRAMSSVRSLPEFPPEAKDSERTFNITIAFEARRFSA